MKEREKGNPESQSRGPGEVAQTRSAGQPLAGCSSGEFSSSSSPAKLNCLIPAGIPSALSPIWKAPDLAEWQNCAERPDQEN